MLQIYLALIVDGSMAYKSKSMVLKPSSQIYETYSSKITDYLTLDNMIRLFLLFKKSEFDRKQNENKIFPIPYYLIGFLGFLIKDNDYNSALNTLFFLPNDEFLKRYNYLGKLTELYYNNYSKYHNRDYNAMIRNKIDKKILKSQIEILSIIDSSLSSSFL